MKEKLVDKTCKNCLYYNSGRGIPCCDYILIKKHSRGCPAGKGCTKKEREQQMKNGLNYSKNYLA